MHFRTQNFRSEYIDYQRGGNSEAQVIFKVLQSMATSLVLVDIYIL